MPATNIKDLKPRPAVDTSTMRPKDQLAHMLARKRNDIAAMLPKGLSVDRLFKLAIVAATTTPALVKCDIPSLVAAVGFCAQLGLEPNTPLGHAYLVPFNTKRRDANGVEYWANSVQVIIGYRGYIELARRSGQIVSISAHEVCQNDKFDFAYGLRERLEHIPARGERGNVIGFYAIAVFKGGGHAMEYMSREQIEAIRDNSQGWLQALKFKKEAKHPWHKDFVEMGRKSAVRRIAKYLPLTVELTRAYSADGRPISESPQLSDPNTIDGDLQWMPDTGDDTPFPSYELESSGEPGDGDESTAPAEPPAQPAEPPAEPPAPQPADEPEQTPDEPAAARAADESQSLPLDDPFDDSDPPPERRPRARASTYERRKG